MDKLTDLNAKHLQGFVNHHQLGTEDLDALKSYLSSRGWERSKPVLGPAEFFLSPHYMNAKGVLYPAVLEALVEINSGRYQECVLTGSIGSGKSSIALYTQAYQLYVLSCYRDPQTAFGLDSASEIVIIFQSLNAKLAKSVDYDRFRTMIATSPYFNNHFSFDRKMESEMRFPHRIIVKPVVGADTGAIGQNVIGGILDEINFMAVVDKSKKSIDGGTYDQALALYNSISRRRKSRFLSKGSLPGMLCLVSSKRYPGQFTDLKEAEAKRELKETGRTSIYVYDKRIWDIKPEAFTGEWFHVFVGDETRQPHLLADSDNLPAAERDLVTQVPEEYRSEFEQDIMNALRDIAGVSTLASHPFLMNFEAVSNCFGHHPSVLSRGETDFKDLKLAIYPKRMENVSAPRFVHVDLALTGDSAGVVMAHVPQFIRMQRGENQFETLPIIHVDFALEVRPPRGGEIIFSKIRGLIYKLVELGVNVKWITFDGFQSADSLQILRQKGFMTGVTSMDKTPIPYEITKTALYDGRVKIPDHQKLLRELQTLEKDTKTGKVDHLIRESKDISDALAGVVYGLTMRREIWAKHGIPHREIPESLKRAVKEEVHTS